MRWFAPLVQMALGLVGAALGFESETLLNFVSLWGMPTPLSVVLGLPLAVGLGGLLAFMAGLWRTWALLSHPGGQEVWASALISVAEEYGTEVLVDAAHGVSLSTVTDGTRLEVVLTPHGDRLMSLWFGCPGLQALLITAVRGAGSSEGNDRWRLVGRRGSWELWAETPASARGLLDEVRFVEDLNRLMAWPTVRAVRHDDVGVEVLAELPEPDRLGGLVRSSLLLARSLARSNG